MTNSAAWAISSRTVTGHEQESSAGGDRFVGRSWLSLHVLFKYQQRKVPRRGLRRFPSKNLLQDGAGGQRGTCLAKRAIERVRLDCFGGDGYDAGGAFGSAGGEMGHEGMGKTG